MGKIYRKANNILEEVSGQTLIHQFYNPKDVSIEEIPINAESSIFHLGDGNCTTRFTKSFADICNILDKLTPMVQDYVFAQIKNGTNSIIHDSVLTSNGLNINGTKCRNVSDDFQVRILLASIDAIEDNKTAKTITNVIFQAKLTKIIGITGDSAAYCILAAKHINSEFKRLKFDQPSLSETNIIEDDNSIPCLPHLLSIVGSSFSSSNETHFKKRVIN
ncbi:hypothetical protein ACTFIY_010600 [Dictyostelium cf. discoideum]